MLSLLLLWFVVCCLLFVACCLLFVVCCLLFVVCCLLFIVCRLLFIVYCLLFVVCCLLFIVYCLLFVVCWWLLLSLFLFVVVAVVVAYLSVPFCNCTPLHSHTMIFSSLQTLTSNVDNHGRSLAFLHMGIIMHSAAITVANTMAVLPHIS